MKKNTLLHYITQFTGVLVAQVPIALRWISIQPDRVNFILKSQFCDTLTNLLINVVYVHIFNFLLKKKFNYRYIIIISLLLIAVTPSFFFQMTNILKWLLWDLEFEVLNWLIVDKATISSFVGYSFYILIYFLTHYWIEYNHQKEKTLKAISLANESQLEMLQYQVNPHFLFNSLNTIQSMIEIDKERAREMIAELSDFFRHTLSGKNQIFLTLREELNAVDKYLSIQKERFRDNLKIHLDVDKNLLDKNIPAFIIHPLIENAIKYGFSTENKILNLSIIIKEELNSLVISVINSGNIKKSEKLNEGKILSTKTGIENIKKRLLLLYPDKHSFSLTEKDNFVTAQIVIEDIS